MPAPLDEDCGYAAKLSLRRVKSRKTALHVTGREDSASSTKAVEWVRVKFHPKKASLHVLSNTHEHQRSRPRGQQSICAHRCNTMFTLSSSGFQDTELFSRVRLQETQLGLRFQEDLLAPGAEQSRAQPGARLKIGGPE